MSKSTDWANLRPDGTPFRTVPSRIHEQDLTGQVLEQGGYDYLTLPMPTELDVLLDRVREDKADPSGKNRNAMAYDCWRMFEDLAKRYKEESAMRDRYKRQSNSWMQVALAQADALHTLSKWPEFYPANANIQRMREFALANAKGGLDDNAGNDTANTQVPDGQEQV